VGDVDGVAVFGAGGDVERVVGVGRHRRLVVHQVGARVHDGDRQDVQARRFSV
jgi:hypothetical protein